MLKQSFSVAEEDLFVTLFVVYRVMYWNQVVELVGGWVGGEVINEAGKQKNKPSSATRTVQT